MTRSIAQMLIVSLSLASPAYAISIDLAGIQVDGSGLVVFTVDNASSAPVAEVSFNFTYTTVPFSANGALASELIVQLGHLPSQTFVQIGTVDGAGNCSGFSATCDFNVMLPLEGGEFVRAGSVVFDQFHSDLLSNLITDGAGAWEVVVGTSVDGGAGPEGQFVSGTLTISQVPLPPAVLVFLSGLSGLAFLYRHR